LLGRRNDFIEDAPKEGTLSSKLRLRGGPFGEEENAFGKESSTVHGEGEKEPSRGGEW